MLMYELGRIVKSVKARSITRDDVVYRIFSSNLVSLVTSLLRLSLNRVAADTQRWMGEAYELFVHWGSAPLQHEPNHYQGSDHCNGSSNNVGEGRGL